MIFPKAPACRTARAPPLQAGFAGLYKLLGLPVVPVAVDSGPLYHRWLKRPGTITLHFGEPIPPGLPRDEIEARVHAAINAAEQLALSRPPWSLAAEIGPRIVLALVDDRAADRAGAGEQVEQVVAVAASGSPRCTARRSSRKRWSISSTASRCAGTRRATSSGRDAAMRVKSRKPPAEYLITSLAGDLLEVRGGADDRVGDQVRADGWSPRAPGRGAAASIVSTLAPSASQNVDQRRRRCAGSAPSGGVTMHQRLWNSVAKPASGPLCSVPATGCAGMTVAAGQAPRRAPRRSLCLRRADIADHRVRLAARRRSPRAASPIAPTGTHRMTRSASATAAPAVSQIVVDKPALARRARAPRDRCRSR